LSPSKACRGRRENQKECLIKDKEAVSLQLSAISL